MMWRTYVCVVGVEDTIKEPPDEVLGLVVIGGVAYMTRHRLGEDGNPLPEESDRRLQVPARALLHALQASINADEDENLGKTYHRLQEDARKRSTTLN